MDLNHYMQMGTKSDKLDITTCVLIVVEVCVYRFSGVGLFIVV